MQRMLGLQMKVMCDRDKVLGILKSNLERHKHVVAEARKGYLVKAREVLEAKLKELEEGKLRTLSVSLTRPQNMASEYKTVIRMLEMHEEPQIELSSDEVRMFIQDKWDWTSRFLAANAGYSTTAAEMVGAGDNNDDDEEIEAMMMEGQG